MQVSRLILAVTRRSYTDEAGRERTGCTVRLADETLGEVVPVEYGDAPAELLEGEMQGKAWLVNIADHSYRAPIRRCEFRAARSATA